MKKIALIILVSLSLTGYSQKITIKKSFWGTKYIQNEKPLSLSELVSTMKSNQEAYNLAKTARSNYITSLIISGAGGFLIGFPLGDAIRGDKPNWPIAGAGAALVLVSIPISISSNKKMKKAINLYNSGLSESSYNFRPRYNFIANAKGFGISISF